VAGPLFFEYSYMRGVRTERYKLLVRTKEWPSELYDLERDPGEKKNRIGDPALATVERELRGEIDRVSSKQGAPPALEQWRGTTKQFDEVQRDGAGKRVGGGVNVLAGGSV
jgi:hypothetical protein